MNKKEFLILRKRGLLLNELIMVRGDHSEHLKKCKIVWFLEFPDESWLRCDKIDYTTNPNKAIRFLTKTEADLFIDHYLLRQFGAIANEHEYVD